MKAFLISAIVALGVLSAGAAQANADLANAQCGKCHAVDKKKEGPPFKETAAKYKGKADAEAVILKTITDAGGDHPEIKTKPDEIKTIIKWVLQQ